MIVGGDGLLIIGGRNPMYWENEPLIIGVTDSYLLSGTLIMGVYPNYWRADP